MRALRGRAAPVLHVGTGVTASFAAVLAVSRLRWILERRFRRWPAGREQGPLNIVCRFAFGNSPLGSRSRTMPLNPGGASAAPYSTFAFVFACGEVPTGDALPANAPVRGNRPLTLFRVRGGTKKTAGLTPTVHWFIRIPCGLRCTYAGRR